MCGWSDEVCWYILHQHLKSVEPARFSFFNMLGLYIFVLIFYAVPAGMKMPLLKYAAGREICYKTILYIHHFMESYPHVEKGPLLETKGSFGLGENKGEILIWCGNEEKSRDWDSLSMFQPKKKKRKRFSSMNSCFLLEGCLFALEVYSNCMHINLWLNELR